MSGLGLRLFRAKLRERPAAAIGGLLSDYLTYVGMVVFWLFLVASKRPLVWLEQRLHQPLRRDIIEWVARLARG
jgi:hypothetical protein